MKKFIELNDGKDWFDPDQFASMQVFDAHPSALGRLKDYMPRVIVFLKNGVCIKVECSDYQGACNLAKRIGDEINKTR